MSGLATILLAASLIGVAACSKSDEQSAGGTERAFEKPPPAPPIVLPRDAAPDAAPVDVEAEIAKLLDPKTQRSAIERLGSSNDPRAAFALVPMLDHDHVPDALRRLGKHSIEPLKQLLNDTDAKTRKLAVMTLGYLDDPVIIDLLLPLLRDKDSGVSSMAGVSLGAKQDVRVARAVIPMLADDDFGKQFGIVLLLEATGSVAVEPLLEAMQDADARIRIGATHALARIKDPRAFDPMMKLLADKEPRVRAAAVTALSQTTVDTRDAFLAMLEDADPNVRLAVVAAIKDPRAVPVLVKYAVGDGNLQRYAIEALGRIRDPSAIDPLVRQMQTERDQYVREVISNALAAYGEPAIDVLVQVLGNTKATQRRDAARALAGIDHERAREALKAAIETKDLATIAGGVRHYCKLRQPETNALLIAALDKFGDVELAHYMLNCNNSDTDAAARAWAKKRGHKIEMHMTRGR
ncbi:MAG TPA: HEAT repeat domain-containing protein [Thermoanaerobaculia bacterium]|nr:HEAT repeat domain-containing protein [Thermoanaerobaculia bacterium]